MSYHKWTTCPSCQGAIKTSEKICRICGVCKSCGGKSRKHKGACLISKRGAAGWHTILKDSLNDHPVQPVDLTGSTSDSYYPSRLKRANQAEATRKYYQKNKQKVKSYAVEYQANNKDKINARRKLVYGRNPLRSS